MTDTVSDRLMRGAQVLRARADNLAQAYRSDMSIRDVGADALADFAEAVVEALAASPQGEGSSGDPAPIKPSGDTGELRKKILNALYCPDISWGTTNLKADAILDLIQSERAGPRVSILSTKFVGDNANGQPIFEGGADGVTNITLHGWTCFGPDEAGQKALAGFQSERAG